MLPARCSRDTFSTSSLRKNIVVFRLVGYPVWIGEATGSNPVYYTLMPDSVMVNISHFDCDVLSSSVSPVTRQNVGFSLIGKVSVCATEEQGSNPGVNQ